MYDSRPVVASTQNRKNVYMRRARPRVTGFVRFNLQQDEGSSTRRRSALQAVRGHSAAGREHGARHYGARFALSDAGKLLAQCEQCRLGREGHAGSLLAGGS